MIIETTVLFCLLQPSRLASWFFCRGGKELLIHTDYGVFVFCAVVVLTVAAALADDADRHSRKASL
jgi:hypothetical protein